MTRIERLPAEIEQNLSAIRDEWMAAGLSTEPADRAAAERGVALAYEAAGLKPPMLTIWLRSPLEGAYGHTALQQLLRNQVGNQVWAQVGNQVWDQVGNQVWAQVRGQVRAQVRGQVRAQVRDQVRGQVRAQVRDQVRDQVWDQVWGQVWGQVWAQVGNQVWDQVWDQVRDQVHAAIWGQHEAGSLAFYDVFERAGIAACSRLRGLATVARSAGWWWAYENAVILTERPTELHRDAEGRLHAESGPALLYPDGWGVWAWHGVRVEREIIEHPDRLTAKMITDEENVEVRRVMMERFTAERFLKEIGSEVIDNSDFGKLHRAPVSDAPGEPLVMVELLNSTAEPDGHFKTYFLRVPPTMERARQAVAWTFGIEQGSKYKPLIET